MYAFTVDLALPMDQAIARLKELLMAEKLGVVSEVDVQAIMKAKLDHDMPAYKMLGICGAGFARRVLAADVNLGALLPCGCAVFDLGGGKTRVALQNPDTVAAATDNTDAKAVMAEARVALEKVAKQLAS
jgi:uncharacterized protein (DUF302 family)